MNVIATLLKPSHVALERLATSKEQLFEQIAQLFEQEDKLSRKIVFESLTSRERLGSTAMGHGLAIPHGRVKHLKTAHCAFFRLANPLSFDAPDQQPVDLVFVVLVPANANEHHLQILSELAQMFSDETLRQQLRASQDTLDAHRLLTEWSSHASGKRSAAL